MSTSGSRGIVFGLLLLVLGWRSVAGVAAEREVTTPADRSERWADTLKVGEAAPAFTLALLPPVAKPGDRAVAAAKPAEPKTVALKDLHAGRPVVLVFGSFTCPPFRNQLADVDRVYDEFRDRAAFLFVYVREAHPGSTVRVVDERGEAGLAKIDQPQSPEARAANAAVCRRTYALRMPVAVDSADNAVGKAYAGWPNRVVIVGADGRIANATRPSPGGTDARRLRAWLGQNLPAAK
ncbi:MAG: deiodinase-like protein [Phycisphaerae bacterium]|nr:deiodinase-like protein [Tepidisphaeraceae bacterium]